MRKKTDSRLSGNFPDAEAVVELSVKSLQRNFFHYDCFALGKCDKSDNCM